MEAFVDRSFETDTAGFRTEKRCTMTKRAKATFIVAALVGVAAATTAVADDAYNKTAKVIALLKTSVDALGKPIRYPDRSPEISMLRVELPPGGATGWHTHPVPGLGYVLEGTLTVEYEGGRSVQLTSGQAFAEAVGVLHEGRNLGTTPVKLVAVFLGEAGKPFAIKRPQ